MKGRAVQHIDWMHAGKMAGNQDGEVRKGRHLLKKKERMAITADEYLKLGEFETYCECQIKLGEWEKALAFAPEVSYEYWQTIVNRHVKYLEEEQNHEELQDYLMLTGNMKRTVQLMMDKRDYTGALLVTSLKDLEKFPTTIEQPAKQPVRPMQNTRETNTQLKDMANKVAESYLQQGKPVKSAAIHLSVNDPGLAITKLLRGNHIYLAWITALLFNLQDYVERIAQRIAQRAENYKQREIAKKILKKYSNIRGQQLFCLHIEDPLPLFEFFGFPDHQDYFSASTALFSQSTPETLPETTLLGFLSQHQEETAINLLEKAKFCLENEPESLLFLMESFDIISQHSGVSKVKSKGVRKQVICYSLYFGLKKAGFKGVLSVYYFIYEQLVKKIKEIEGFPVKVKDVDFEVYSYLIQQNSKEFNAKLVKLKEKLLKTSHREKVENMKPNQDNSEAILEQMQINSMVFVEDNLPVNSLKEGVFTSLVTGKVIKGDGVVLNDKNTQEHSFLTMQEALLLQQTIGFSPIFNGEVLNAN